MNKEGAVAGMITGLLFTATYIIYFKFVNPTGNKPENWLLGISPEGIGTIGMLVNFGTAFVVSKMTGDVPQDVVDMVESIRVPKGAGAAHDH